MLVIDLPTVVRHMQRLRDHPHTLYWMPSFNMYKDPGDDGRLSQVGQQNREL